MKRVFFIYLSIKIYNSGSKSWLFQNSRIPPSGRLIQNFAQFSRRPGPLSTPSTIYLSDKLLATTHHGKFLSHHRSRWEETAFSPQQRKLVRDEAPAYVFCDINLDADLSAAHRSGCDDGFSLSTPYPDNGVRQYLYKVCVCLPCTWRTLLCRRGEFVAGENYLHKDTI